MADRKRIVAALAVFALALLLRLWFLLDLKDHPYFEHLMIDSASYDRWAGRIADGDFWGSRVFYQAPLYPYFLGGLYALFGRDLTVVRVAQAALGSVTCVLLFLLGARLFTFRTGLLAGVLAALYSTFIFQDQMILKSVVVFFFLSLSLLRLARWADSGGWPALGAAGFLFGVAISGRGNLLFAVPFVTLWILARGVRPFRGSSIRTAGVFLLGGALAIAPVTLRNRIVGGDWVMTESDAGINVYVGNNPAATGIHTPPFTIRTVPEYEERDAAKLAEQELGRRPLKPSEVSRFWIAKAVRFAILNPGAEAKLVGRKFLLAWNDREVPDNYDQAYFARVSPLFRGFLPSFVWVSPFAVLGMVVSLRDWRRTGFLHLFVIAYILSLLALYVTSRYRLPVVIGLVPFAAHGALWFGGRLRGRSWGAAGSGAILLVLVFLLGKISLLEEEGFAKQEAEIATFYADDGDVEEAERAFERAIGEGRGSANLHLVYMNQGMFYARLGQTGRAAEAFRNALRVNPAFTPALLELEKLTAGAAATP
ncbi:MAG: glycosyltransferase family 39 protein [Candidatus Eisenbacteria bacterium]